MITEIEARELLTRAASTIEVPSGELVLLAPPQRPRWIAPVVAAAAIAAAVATGLVLIHDNDRSDRPGPVAPTPTPTLDPFAGRVPSVFAYDGDSAQQLLEDRGLRVRRQVVTNRCETPNRALRTKPSVTSLISLGDEVTLYVSGPLVNFCHPADLTAWQLLDFANGRGPAPSFGSKAAYYLNGKASDQSSVLAGLAALTRQISWSLGAPSLQVVTVDSPPTCFSTSVPERYWSQEALLFYIAFPLLGSYLTCPSAEVFLDDQNNIDAIAARVPPDVTDPPEPTAVPDPDGVGASFVRFAKGGAAPAFAPRVRLLYGDRQDRIITAAEARDRSRWWVCFSEMVSNCPLITEIAAQANPGRIFTREDSSACTLRRANPPHAGWWSVVVQPRHWTCDDYALQVFYDSAKRITAVSALTPIP